MARSMVCGETTNFPDAVSAGSESEAGSPDSRPGPSARRRARAMPRVSPPERDRPAGPMKHIALTAILALALSGAAVANDPERVCGDFAVLKGPEAVRYAGRYDKFGRQYTVVIAEKLENGKALVFYVLGPGGTSPETCIIRVGEFKDKDFLFVKLGRTTSITLRPEAGEFEWQKRDNDGYITRREPGSLGVVQ